MLYHDIKQNIIKDKQFIFIYKIGYRNFNV